MFGCFAVWLFGCFLVLCPGFIGKAKAGDGKSGQLFLMTKNKNIVIKTLKSYEAVFLKKILHKYLHHMQKYPGSLLCKFYDVVTLVEPSTNCKVR